MTGLEFTGLRDIVANIQLSEKDLQKTSFIKQKLTPSLHLTEIKSLG